jgi:hypothetical protein
MQVAAETDFVAWAECQAIVLRAGDEEGLDRHGIADALLELASRNLSRGRALTRRTVRSLLLLEFGPEALKHEAFADVVSTSRKLSGITTPTVVVRLATEIEEIYAAAARWAADDLADGGGGADKIPVRCPYTIADVMGEKVREMA